MSKPQHSSKSAMTAPTPPSAMPYKPNDPEYIAWSYCDREHAIEHPCPRCIGLVTAIVCVLSERDERIEGLEAIREADGQAMEKMAKSCDALEAQLREREREVERLREALEFIGKAYAIDEEETAIRTVFLNALRREPADSVPPAA